TLAPSGEPQAALVGYAVSPDLELIFDTLRTTRKYRNMIVHPRVSFTIGNTAGSGDERTVQYEGVAEELAGESLDRLQAVYFSAWPDGVNRVHWPHITWFVIRPRWIRYSDFNIPMTQEWSF
ncbi:MAG TPA: pyridoxamine 5'-phosphate oxidase family protein, partial [Acidobacteriaceae bacterium]|nr:pyridoxamine 5'-phosphate oxidase family protein [Acidobacteriaceae bacterium]